MFIDFGAKISNQLSRGEFDDFRKAVSSLKKAMHFEKQTEDTPSAQEFWQEEIDRCQKALDIYEELYQSFLQETVAALRQEGLDEFADGLEQGDYSHLAY